MTPKQTTRVLPRARKIMHALLIGLLLAVMVPVDSAQAASSTAELQRLLREKGFYRGSVNGVYGSRTQHAVMAFRKEIGASRSYSWSSSLWDDLEIYQAPYTEHNEPDRLEINLTKQTAHLFRNGDLVGTFPISSGNGEYFVNSAGNLVRAVTPTGNFTVFRHRSGWYESYLGSLLNPWFFNGGIAIHGSPSVPSYPASHGCVRLTTWDSDFINDYLYIGIPVHVFRSNHGPVYGSDGPFADVPADHTFVNAVEWMVLNGYTNGCHEYFFCPDDPASRGEIAAFMKRILQTHLGDNGRRTFTDTNGHAFEDAIGWLAGHEITLGCDPPNYTRFCPDRPVSRGEMSALFKRAIDHLLTVEPSELGTFTDTGGHLFEGSAAWLAGAQITVGCNPPANTMYCPDDWVTRGQLATFLKRVADHLSA